MEMVSKFNRLIISQVWNAYVFKPSYEAGMIPAILPKGDETADA